MPRDLLAILRARNFVKRYTTDEDRKYLATVNPEGFWRHYQCDLSAKDDLAAFNPEGFAKLFPQDAATGSVLE